MVPLSTAAHSFGPEATLSLGALLEQLGEADTPYRAWAAMALARARDVRHRAAGEALMRRLRDELPALGDDLDHGDVAAYATVADACLTREERRRLAAALPVPHGERTRRSRLFDSPLYVYLIARGLTGDLPEPSRLAAFVAEVTMSTAERAGTDLPDLVLRLATAFELAGALPVPDVLLRAVHGRLVSASGDPQAALALRWLLERYGATWPPSADASALKGAVESYVESNSSGALATAGLRLAVAAMQLEMAMLENHEYQLVPQAHVRRAVSQGLGRHRMVATLAYAISLGVVAAAPAAWLVFGKGLAWPLPAVAALATWLPAVCWSTLTALGRQRRGTALGSAIALAVAYYGLLLAAALTESDRLASLAAGEALWAFLPTAIATVAGVLPAGKD